MATKTNITLLPCPCCGAPAKLSDDYENGDGEPAVECSACNLLSWTVEDWNRRAAPVAAQVQPRLYQHDDGRYSLSFGPAQFAVGNPAWHRVPIDVIDAAQPRAHDREDGK